MLAPSGQKKRLFMAKIRREEGRGDQKNRLMAEVATLHVLIFPFPIQGHVNPMLKLAEVLSMAGLHVTFLNTETIHDRLIRSELFKRLSVLPTCRFRSLSDGQAVNDPHNSFDFLDLMESLTAQSKETYKEMLAPSGRDADGWPNVTCVIADGIFPLALEGAEEMKIPVMIFRTSSACSVWMYYSIPKLIQSGKLPFSEDTDMDELAEVVEGMESFLRLRDLSGLVRSVKSVNDRLMQFMITMSNNLSRASAFILNTAEHLEAIPLPHIRSICPITFTIGPLQLLQRTYNSNAQPWSTVSLWEEDHSCMKWLDRQPHKSVVYVCFGSTTVVSRESLLEFWHGLLNSGHQFLWVIRPDMLEGGIDSKEAFGASTTDKGFLVKWAPQEDVLVHPSVGCFITHSGWNSTLESIVSGVPMICWPFFADQQVNSRFVGEVWKIGIDMKDTCERSIIEKMVRKVMDDGEEAQMLRKRACKMMEGVKMSVEKGGSSYTNFQKLIQHIRSFNSLHTNPAFDNRN